MQSMSAKEAKQSFGVLLESAQRGPVTITRNGRKVAVLLSRQDFERLEALEDAMLAAKAEEALKEGYIGGEESERLLHELLDAED